MQAKDQVAIPFHFLNLNSAAATVFYVPCNPQNLSSRMASEADAWSLFKLTKLRFRLHPRATTSGGSVAGGYYGTVADTPPATQAQVMELLASTYLSYQQTKPSDWVNVSPKELAGPFPWYKSIPGAADATEEQPGSLAFCTSGATDLLAVELEGVCVFRDSIATANTPLMVSLQLKMREERARAAAERRRSKLLLVLGGAQPSSVTGARP